VSVNGIITTYFQGERGGEIGGIASRMMVGKN
jgi:hypothetical protein